MNTLRHPNSSPLVLSALLGVLLTGCGGGGGAPADSRSPPPVASPGTPGNNPDPVTPSDPGTPPGPLPGPTVSIPVGLPALYISTAEDASVFNNIIGDFIDGSTQTLIQFVPASGETAILSTNRSVEFASSMAWLKVFDDELYILTTTETGAYVERLAPDNLMDVALQTGGRIPTPAQFESVSQGCFAVLNEDIYYKVSWREAPFPGTGFADGPVVRVDDFFASAAGGETTTLDPGMGGDSPSPGGFVTDACYFNTDVADGIWYDTEANLATGEVNFYTRDPQTGEASLVAGITGFDAIRDTHRVSNFAFDQQSVYFATLNLATQEVEIGRQSLFGDFAIETVLPPTPVDGPAATSIDRLDVDDGHVAFVLNSDNASVVAIYDPNTSMLQFMDLGVRVNQMALVFREQ